MQHLCRNCGSVLGHVFCDLGMQPLANGLLTEEQCHEPQTYYPLKAFVCQKCLLVQLPPIVRRERMFSDYAYFSGQSAQWRNHCAALAEDLMEEFGREHAVVVEIASNDGTLSAEFNKLGARTYGVDPARTTYEAAKQNGVFTIQAYWGRETASWIEKSDIIVGQNVLAHVPDLDDFVGGVRDNLKPEGVAVFEFPWLVNLIEQAQWDTIYHEHYSYLSFWSAQYLLADRGLRIFRVEQTTTHGGSLRIFCCHTASREHMAERSLGVVSDYEVDNGYHNLRTYTDFEAVPRHEREIARNKLMGEMWETVGYGAPAKGITFLNYCGLGTETIKYIVDSTPAKQGMYTPGTRIPIYSPSALQATRPTRILVLPWNWLDEIKAKIKKDCDWHPIVRARPFT